MKNKILLFSVGLVSGLVLGVLFSVAIKELLIEFKELHLSLNKINLKQSQLSQRLDSIQGKLVPDTKRSNTANAQANLKTTNQNASKNQTPQEAVKPEPETKPSASSNTSAASDSDVVVMTNQLVSVSSIRLQNKDTNTISKRDQKTDSTIAAMSNVSETKERINYRVEFWESPLNYKGYKMSAGKIVLYGINSDTPLSLVLEEGAYYLLFNQGAYKVDYTDDYKPFDKITDKGTLKKLGI